MFKRGVISNHVLADLCGLLDIKLRDVVTKDQLIQMRPQYGGYIINLQDSSEGSGTHWVALWCNTPKTAVYFDSFGMPPPDEVKNFVSGKLTVNKRTIQDIKDDACGFHCVLFLYYIQNLKGTLKQRLDKHLKIYTNIPAENDDIVYKAFDHLLAPLNSGIKRGGSLQVGELHNLLDASYNKTPPERLGRFELDEQLSNDVGKVYHDHENGQTVITHRGTQGSKDMLNNFLYSLGLYETTSRYKKGKALQEKAYEKYGKENITTVGHSQGAVLARKLGHDSKEVITLNPAYLGERALINEYNIRSSLDPVSILKVPSNAAKQLLYPKHTAKHEKTIKSKSWNPIAEHSTDVLKQHNLKELIGRGLVKHKEQIAILLR